MSLKKHAVRARIERVFFLQIKRILLFRRVPFFLFPLFETGGGGTRATLVLLSTERKSIGYRGITFELVKQGNIVEEGVVGRRFKTHSLPSSTREEEPPVYANHVYIRRSRIIRGWKGKSSKEQEHVLFNRLERRGGLVVTFAGTSRAWWPVRIAIQPSLTHEANTVHSCFTFTGSGDN